MIGTGALWLGNVGKKPKTQIPANTPFRRILAQSPKNEPNP